MSGNNSQEKNAQTPSSVAAPPLAQQTAADRQTHLGKHQKFVMKDYQRGKVMFKIGLFMVLTMPPIIFYYKKHQKDLYARGIIKDMQRINEKGKSIHDIPKYGTDVSFGKRL